MKHPLVVLALAVLAFGSACGHAEAPSRVDPKAAIEGFDSSPQAGSGPRSRLNTAVLSDPAGSHKAALEHLSSSDGDVRIAALYALALTVRPDDAAALASSVASADERERVLAASALLAIGGAQAVPVLIASLGSDDPLPFGAPPLKIWQQARAALLAFTGQDLGLSDARTAEEAGAISGAWEAWWAEAGSTFEVVRSPGRFEP